MRNRQPEQSSDLRESIHARTDGVDTIVGNKMFVAAGPVSRIRRVTLQLRKLLNRNPRELVNGVNFVSDRRFCVTPASQSLILARGPAQRPATYTYPRRLRKQKEKSLTLNHIRTEALCWRIQEVRFWRAASRCRSGRERPQTRRRWRSFRPT
jgi:hypothetical protein